ncbi:hypothetical protein TNCV_4619591 [Trichonephila clavipes]|nr:hypothetical protein TNCV_4619591 [Trichonephila clavipes]
MIWFCNPAEYHQPVAFISPLLESSPSLYQLSSHSRPLAVKIADSGHRMGERNVRCDLTPGWEESYK